MKLCIVSDSHDRAPMLEAAVMAGRDAGAEAVLRLRALMSSGDFETYWRFHEEEEARRNHVSRYADGKVPEVQLSKAKARLRLVG